MNYTIEICANSVESCIEAERGGAQRVELCAGIPEGGTTPSYGDIAMAKELTKLKVHVIIRPRGGDFLYTDIEHRTMLHDIDICKKLGADGIVIGTLKANGEIDMERNRELIERSEGMSVTFHRAFDMCNNAAEGLEKLIELGCQRVLTSGQQKSAELGIPLLKQLVEQANGRIIVMPGCGISEDNVEKIAIETGATELHMSIRRKIESGMRYRNDAVSMGGTSITINEFERDITSEERVKEVLKRLNSLN